MHAVLVLALVLQVDDKVKAFEADLAKRMKEYETFTVAAMADAVRFTIGTGGAKGPVGILETGAEAITKAILALETKPPELRRALGYIEKARKRAAGLASDEQKIPALRYGLQRAFMAYQNEAGAVTDLFNMSIEFLADGAYAEAEEALKEVEERLPALKATTLEQTPEAPRMAAIFLGRIELARGNYKEAAAALRRGLDGLPEWGDKEIDLKKLCRKEGEHDRIVKALDDYIAKNPDDADALLLKAHEIFFSADRKKSATLFQSLLKKDAKNKYAQYFLDHMPED